MPAETITVQTRSGPVVGFKDTFPIQNESSFKLEPKDGGKAEVLKWLGVPYAQAKRFERPTEPKSWTEPLPCHEFGTAFPQNPSPIAKLFSAGLNGYLREFIGLSEDSHTVNVFCPEGTKEGDNLPVMFWIYGGSLDNGSSHIAMYDPTEWVRAEAQQGRKFVVVTANYRTNIFGWFSGPEVAAADEKGLSGNYGLYDCVAALEWVQANISKFGGSPEQVTAFGESAGAFLVSTLLVSGKTLFQRAIMQSGAATTMSTHDLEQGYGAYSAVLNNHGSGATPQARMESLRKASVADLLKTHLENYSFTGLGLTIETGDHAIWNERVMDKLERGECDEWITSVIIGTNEDEGSIFAFAMQLNTPAGFNGYVSNFPKPFQGLITKHYLGEEGEHPEKIGFVDAPASKLLSDQIFLVPAWNQIKAIAGQPNKKSGKNTKVYVYRFRETIDKLSQSVPTDFGVMHAAEIAFVFNVNIAWSEDSHEAKTAALMGSLWSKFAISGNPDPNWQPFTSQRTWFAINPAGETENESLANYEDSLIDFSGKNFGKPADQIPREVPV